MAKVIIEETGKTALKGTGDGEFSKEQAEAQAEKMNKKAEKLGIKTRYKAA